jgi:hypothetical protein
MAATRSQIRTQYERAKRLGWIPYFQEAAKTITRGRFDTADLMAIGSRESNLDPKWLTKAGDNGNGFGLMQADKRSFPNFTKTDAWKDAKTGILFGAEVLMQKWKDNQSGIGLKRGVKSSKTGRMSYFIGKDIGQGFEAQEVTIASYNAGRWPAYAVSIGRHPDTYTTGKDYSQDVLARAKVFRELLAKDFPASSPVASITSEIKEGPTVNPLNTAGSTGDPKPIETTVTREENGVTVEASKPNQQDVSEKALVDGGSPYRDIGFWGVIKKDLAAATGGNLSLSALTEYAQQASGWPEWIIAIISKVAVGALIATIGYFVFRTIHYVMDRLQNKWRVQVEAEAKTAIDRKDIVWK